MPAAAAKKRGQTLVLLKVSLAACSPTLVFLWMPRKGCAILTTPMIDATEDEPVAPRKVVAPAAAAASSANAQDLAALYPLWYPRLVRYFCSSGCSEAQAHDLTQDSFAAALRGLPGFRGESQLSTWLWEIAVNVLRASLRRKLPLDMSVDSDSPLEDLRVFEAPHLSDCMDCVRRALARFHQLEPDRAQALFLAYVEGWTRAELAAHLGRSEHATTVYLAQCRARFLPLMQNCHDC